MLSTVGPPLKQLLIITTGTPLFLIQDSYLHKTRQSSRYCLVCSCYKGLFQLEFDLKKTSVVLCLVCLVEIEFVINVGSPWRLFGLKPQFLWNCSLLVFAVTSYRDCSYCLRKLSFPLLLYQAFLWSSRPDTQWTFVLLCFLYIT